MSTLKDTSGTPISHRVYLFATPDDSTNAYSRAGAEKVVERFLEAAARGGIPARSTIVVHHTINGTKELIEA